MMLLSWIGVAAALLNAPGPHETGKADGVPPRLGAFSQMQALGAAGDLEGALELARRHDAGADPVAVAFRFHRLRFELARGDRVSPELVDFLAPRPGRSGPKVRWGISRQQEAEGLLSLTEQLAQRRPERAKRLRLRAAIDYPRWVPELEGMSRSELRARSAALNRDMDYRGALAILERLAAESKGRDRLSLLREMGQLLGDKMRDDYPRVAVLYEEVTADSSSTPDDLLYLAYAVSKFDSERVIEIYRSFLARFPNHSSAAKAAFFIAWTVFDLERLEESVELFTSFVEDHSGSGYRFSARWYRGLALFRLRRFDEARADFEYTARYTSHRDKGRYWVARTHLEQGKPDLAAPLLVRVSSRDPLSYYAMMARAWLPASQRPDLYDPRPDRAPQGISDEQAAKSLARISPRVRTMIEEAVAVARVGHGDLALALADFLESRRGSASGFASIKPWLHKQIGAALRFARSSTGQGCRRLLDDDPSRPEAAECWRAWYPALYARQIDSVRGPVPRELFWAIMRQESFFLPHARSHADALGLLQLIPQVGQPAAAARGWKFAPYELYRPEVNLALFAEAAKQRHAQYDGSIPLMLMSYNATPERTTKWLRDNHDLPFDLFVEEIPYSETRDYVKRISLHLVRYRTLAGDHQGALWERAGLPHPGDLAGEAFPGALQTALRHAEPSSSAVARAFADAGR